MVKNSFVLIILSLCFTLAMFQVDYNPKASSADDYNVKSTYEPIVVLELFTSQGCSSCPSADLLLQKVKNEYQESVFALSYHVDYWNYIGWKDPFSKAWYTNRQRTYNIKFQNSTNYTPQLVVNGKEHFVGSNTAKMYNRIKTYKEKKSENRLDLSNVTLADGKVSVDYEVQGSIANKAIRAILVIDERTTHVKRGENRNRTLNNSNIVVAEKEFKLIDAKGDTSISIPKIVNPSDQLHLILLVENDDHDVTAASKQKLMR